MPNAKQYAKCKEKWIIDNEAFLKEKQRINQIVKNRYQTDVEYRNKCIEYQRLKNEKLKLNKVGSPPAIK